MVASNLSNPSPRATVACAACGEGISADTGLAFCSECGDHYVGLSLDVARDSLTPEEFAEHMLMICSDPDEVLEAVSLFTLPEGHLGRIAGRLMDMVPEWSPSR